MDKLINTKYGNISIDLDYTYDSVYDIRKELAPIIRHNINEINTCNEFEFYAARLSTEEDGNAWPVDTVLRAHDSDYFVINGVEYNRLYGSFKIRLNEKTSKHELWDFSVRAHRAGGQYTTYGALTDKAAKTIREFLAHTLLTYVLNHDAEIRQERRLDLLKDAKEALNYSVKRADEYKTAVDNLTQIVHFPGWDKV